MTCNHSRTHYGVCKSCTYEDLLVEEEPCCTCVHRNTQCNWKPKNEISKMGKIKGIYQVFVYDGKPKKFHHRTSSEWSRMIESFIEEFGHYKDGSTLVEGLFRFIKDGKGGYWIDFRPTHPSR